MKNIMVSDFTIKEVPYGGSEWVNQVVIEKYNLDFEYSNKITSFNTENFYIISNISLMDKKLIPEILKCKYIILEHDYKICPSRHPWRYPNSIIPKGHRINYELYEKAEAVFVQTTDHMNVYLKNGVKGNFINLKSSLWSDEDLEKLRSFNRKQKNGKYAIYNSNNWIKNTQGSLKYCQDNNLSFELIPNCETREEFLDRLSNCSHLVFFPIARETFCRLVVEAKCMGVDVITTKNYGASLEDYFDLMGDELITFLKFTTKSNLKKIGEFINV